MMAALTSGRLPWRMLIFSVLSTFVGLSLQDMTQSYCSSQNTGADHFSAQNVYNSNGACSDSCRATNAFAVVQGLNCWCSDFIPQDQKKLDSCNEKCPGYPYEDCGSTTSKLYGYIALDKKPSGTAKGSASTASTPQSPNQTPTTSQTVVTVGGTVITQTVTTLPTFSPDKMTQKPKASSTIGTAVGAAVGAVALILGIVFGCLWYRRRKRSSFEHEPMEAFPRRNTSVLSKTGLLGTRSSTNALDPSESTSPISERRNSRPLIFDQRLNPNAFMTHDDGSRSSILTMQDNRDYTRTLNVRNPDPVD